MEDDHERRIPGTSRRRQDWPLFSAAVAVIAVVVVGWVLVWAARREPVPEGPATSMTIGSVPVDSACDRWGRRIYVSPAGIAVIAAGECPVGSR